ncbi:ferritin-like domain-containing protein [Frankia sp. CNm7]|uniref:Ferritin-like domain-containing protein n=1 Tax=Frankia nepalensis TaxID=1836974 RepID=A0A937RFG6_9ACTN|nr:ferritin-like domain-containing protein [Frankia nepalensis]MBL7495655.1 ferritin-like domain-containing protein [Frankia nepalensis]MBL7510279.1 ferritin-like domain-containing protein [Frankia nepalensis]MBL7520465.1 ferritin-like domain-containing protein [Frankia nepalensis]MBL7631188.1 ferritin-like domain-containing protein [Frankia nepalensis]
MAMTSSGNGDGGGGGLEPGGPGVRAGSGAHPRPGAAPFRGKDGDGGDDIFDLDRFLRVSRRLDLSAVAWDEVRAHELTPDEARTLTYMMDIESHTIIYLRDLLATRAALEPDVTAFLSCWAYEELWHGEALSRFLGEAGYRSEPDRGLVQGDSPFPSRIARNRMIRRRVTARDLGTHLGMALASAAMRDFVALHMTWGAVNELSTLTAYRRLAAKTGHPVLRALLTEITKDERRHFAFYRAQARLRLGRSPAARAITRWALDHVWSPVGSGVRPRAETDHTIAYLFGDAAGRAAAADLDRVLGRLPGLAGIDIVSRSVAAATGRVHAGAAAAAGA